MRLNSQGNLTNPPSDHTVRFVGTYPCKADGSRYEKLVNGPNADQIAPDLTASYLFSQKPQPHGKYADYHEKMTTHIVMLENEAQAIDHEVTARTFPVIEDDDEDSVFKYMDTASSRAGINVITEKLKQQVVGIIGLGGTGSYILDLVAKTPVREIHIYDGDALLQHNAFRMPGAMSTEELQARTTKVAYLGEVYSKLRNGVVPHSEPVTSQNVNELRTMDFVFMSLTDGAAKLLIVKELEEHHIPFIDVGMGIEEVDSRLLGQLRTATSVPDFRDHIHTGNRIPFTDGEKDDYSHNIQIADLNALNACMAVIKWKKLCGFYADLEREHFSVYSIDGNHLLNEDQQP